MHKITITKPFRRWLFGGLGFHNSEATMTPIMSEVFLNQRVLKTFREISPTFSRVYGGFADWTQEAMDRFADYYDQTFRNAGTLIYMVPGRMPMPTEDFDYEDYYERTARKLHYLIKVRGCTKIRYFCVTNELSVGNSYAWLAKRLDMFKDLQLGLYRAFQRYGLDVGLVAADSSGEKPCKRGEVWNDAGMGNDRYRSGAKRESGYLRDSDTAAHGTYRLRGL